MASETDEFYGYACPGLAMSVANIDSAAVIPLETLNAVAFQSSPTFSSLRGLSPSDERYPAASPGEWSASDVSTEGTITTPRPQTSSFPDTAVDIYHLPDHFYNHTASTAQHTMLHPLIPYPHLRSVPAMIGLQDPDAHQYTTDFKHHKLPASTGSSSAKQYVMTSNPLMHATPHRMPQLYPRHMPQIPPHKRPREEDFPPPIPGRDKRRKISLPTPVRLTGHLSHAMGPYLIQRNLSLPTYPARRRASTADSSAPLLTSSLNWKPILAPAPPLKTVPVEDEDQDAEGEEYDEDNNVAYQETKPIAPPSNTKSNQISEEPEDDYESSEESLYEDDDDDEDYTP